MRRGGLSAQSPPSAQSSPSTQSPHSAQSQSFLVSWVLTPVLLPAGAMYIDASYPRKKGDKARLQSAYLLHTHTCLRFSYHMNGSATGRLNVYKQSYNGTQALLWRLADRQGLGWRPAEVPLAEDLPYRVSRASGSTAKMRPIATVSAWRETNWWFLIVC